MIATGFFFAYNGELKRANRALQESRGKIQVAYTSEASARRRAEAAEDQARNALVLAGCLLDAMEITRKYSPQMELSRIFPAYDAPQFKEAMTKNQAIAERIAYSVDEALTQINSVHEVRDRETSSRWQGYYDLIMGRFLAMKVRCYEYNWACARMKKDPPRFSNPNSNGWRLVPDPEILYSRKAAEAAREARELLQRVVHEHPGTELALQAQRELDEPVGFRWVETSLEPKKQGDRREYPSR